MIMTKSMKIRVNTIGLVVTLGRKMLPAVEVSQIIKILNSEEYSERKIQKRKFLMKWQNL